MSPTSPALVSIKNLIAFSKDSLKYGNDDVKVIYLRSILDSPLDPLNVVAVGEIKKQVGESFSNTDIEHTISFGEKSEYLKYNTQVRGPSKGNTPVAMKIMKKANYLSCLERERAVLKELSKLESPHIPKILFYDESTLVITHLGKKVNTLRKTDIKDIVSTLEHVHSYGYVYWDL
ncbi:27091_t:CDS:2 [Dentiscutata erythropus]|uniref:27091_t:CDS:1 n=1 Tax=Dentiscutata erythropus TaxID=1348616 RepID=A0A9N8VTR5_9GLOM|nr:27091_t:CDS:2 [Dentiscutata erythropus]